MILCAYSGWLKTYRRKVFTIFNSILNEIEFFFVASYEIFIWLIFKVNIWRKKINYNFFKEFHQQKLSREIILMSLSLWRALMKIKRLRNFRKFMKYLLLNSLNQFVHFLVSNDMDVVILNILQITPPIAQQKFNVKLFSAYKAYKIYFLCIYLYEKP